MNEYVLPLFLTAGAQEHSWWSSFFDFFSAFGTLMSVLVIVFVYYRQLSDEKRNAARILLMEIRVAEKTITDIKNTGVVSEITLILPTNSWQKFQHLFISNLNQDELTLINDFYNLGTVIQKEVDRMKNHLPISNEEKIKVTQQLFAELAKKYKDSDKNFDKDSDYTKERDSIRQILDEEENWFMPNINIKRLQQYLPNIRYITATTCDSKLKKIAKVS